MWSNGTGLAQGATFADGYVTFNATGGALDVRVAPTGTTTAPAPAPAKSATKVAVKGRPKRVTTARKPHVTIAVSGAGAAATGKVKVRVDGELVDRVALNRAGKARVVLNRFSVGKHKVVVIYPGSTTTTKSRKTKTVRVSRR